MKIALVGIGHVGLVSAAAFASLGHEVVGLDVDASKVKRLEKGEPPFYEPQLEDLLRDGVDSGRLRFTVEPAEAIPGARVVFICVGRPPVGLGDRSLTAVEDTVRVVARHADEHVVLVVKSTVPPGTCARAEQVMRQERPGVDVSVAMSPEFLREGHAVEDTLRPDRLVVGAEDARAFDVLRELYAPMLDQGVPLIQTDSCTAELSKLSSNAFLAMKISFANALARVAERAGADVTGITHIMGADARIGPAFLGAGLGYGGYCLPKDVVTLVRVADRLGYEFNLLHEVVRINQQALDAVARTVADAVWNLEGKTVALLGLAFKGGTDDVRSSPALALARYLLDEGARVVGYDPMASEEALREVPSLEIAPDAIAAATGAACVVVCTDWPEFRSIDLGALNDVMATPVLVDGRNLLDPAAVRAAGLSYVGVGR
jgi:UDPglucose 6-dehydrogenase